jgi:hypothetical protein
VCLGGRRAVWCADGPEKTRLLEFGPFAAENRKQRAEGKPVSLFVNAWTLSFLSHRDRFDVGGVFVIPDS